MITLLHDKEQTDMNEEGVEYLHTRQIKCNKHGLCVADISHLEESKRRDGLHTNRGDEQDDQSHHEPS